AWALHGTGVGVERSLGERAVVVRAAILDRVEVAVAVEDADLDALGGVDQLHLSARQLARGANVDLLFRAFSHLFLPSRSDFSDHEGAPRRKGPPGWLRHASGPMKAMVMQPHVGPEFLVAEQVERPAPAPGEVVIEMAAAGLNPVDTQVRAGSWVPDAMGRPPMILGWDVAGTIAEVGDGVTSFESGVRFFGVSPFPS